MTTPISDPKRYKIFQNFKYESRGMSYFQSFIIATQNDYVMGLYIFIVICPELKSAVQFCKLDFTLEISFNELTL